MSDRGGFAEKIKVVNIEISVKMASTASQKTIREERAYGFLIQSSFEQVEVLASVDRP